MTLYEQFMTYTKENGIDMSDVFHQKEEDFEMVAFGEKVSADNGIVYSIVFVFYDKIDVAEIYIRKQIKIKDELSVLKKINEYNCTYRGLTFFIDQELLTAKSFCVTGGDVRVALKMMAKDMKVVQDLFKDFESV